MLGTLSQISPINTCCDDKYAQLFTKARAKKLAVDQSIALLRDHTHKQKTQLNRTIVAIDLLLDKDPSQKVKFVKHRNDLREAQTFYEAVAANESILQTLTDPLNAILDTDASDQCKCTKLKMAKKQIKAFNAGLNSVEYKLLRAIKSRDAQTKRDNDRLRHALTVAQALDKGC